MPDDERQDTNLDGEHRSAKADAAADAPERTEHATGERQAAENRDNESPS